MKIILYNIDGSELAMWYSDLCFTPSFQRLPNDDPRCPYQISINNQPSRELETGMSLNHAIRSFLKANKREIGNDLNGFVSRVARQPISNTSLAY